MRKQPATISAPSASLSTCARVIHTTQGETCAAFTIRWMRVSSSKKVSGMPMMMGALSGTMLPTWGQIGMSSRGRRWRARGADKGKFEQDSIQTLDATITLGASPCRPFQTWSWSQPQGVQRREGTETSTCVSESVHGVRMTRQRHGALCGVVGRACTNAKNNESSQSEERIGLEMLWGLRAYVNSADPAGQHLLNESVN
jgi:hypothetical protein